MDADLGINGLFDVRGKVAVVTGGSRGIGAMIARGLVTNGVRTYITARKAEACDATAAELSELGECHSIPADLSTEEGLATFVTAFGGAGGPAPRPGQQRRARRGALPSASSRPRASTRSWTST